MTPADIDGMAAGPELDAMVGKAIGAKPRIVYHASQDGGQSSCASTHRDGPWCTRGELAKWLAEHQAAGRMAGYEIVPLEHWEPYSSDGAAMLLVVEAMRAKGWEWDANTNPFDGGYDAAFLRRGYETEYEWAVDLPHATALAALKALAGGKA